MRWSKTFFLLFLVIGATAEGHGPTTAPDSTPPEPERTSTPTPTPLTESELSIQQTVERTIGSPTGEAEFTQSLQFLFPGATEAQLRTAARLLRGGYDGATRPLRGELQTANERGTRLEREVLSLRGEMAALRDQQPVLAGGVLYNRFRGTNPPNNSYWGMFAGRWHMVPEGTPGATRWTAVGGEWQLVGTGAAPTTYNLSSAPAQLAVVNFGSGPMVYVNGRFVPYRGSGTTIPAVRRPTVARAPTLTDSRAAARTRLFQFLSN